MPTGDSVEFLLVPDMEEALSQPLRGSEFLSRFSAMWFTVMYSATALTVDSSMGMTSSTEWPENQIRTSYANSTVPHEVDGIKEMSIS